MPVCCCIQRADKGEKKVTTIAMDVSPQGGENKAAKPQESGGHLKAENSL